MRLDRPDFDHGPVIEGFGQAPSTRPGLLLLMEEQSGSRRCRTAPFLVSRYSAATVTAALAVTLARTLLEDVCKWLLNETGGTWEEADDLPTLYKRLAKALNLAPDSHTEHTFKQILGSCQAIVEGLGALRNKLGDAHSVGPKERSPVDSTR
jgi:hypothetical protein